MKLHSKKLGKSAIVGLSALVLCAAMIFAICVSSVKVASASAPVTGFYVDFATFDELEDAAADVGIQVAEEGAILLKNRDALPLNPSEMRVSVFGEHSDNILRAGGGAGGGSSARNKTLQDSMEAAGFRLNPMLVSYYANANPANESDPALLESVKPSFAAYNGAAIVVISRSGSEMRDITINNTSSGLPGHSNKEDHSMMLEDNERALIEYVKGSFSKVIVVFNTPAPMEVAELEDDDDVSAMLWIGLTGAEGIMALGKILSGEVNPSGRTVDVHAATFDTEPTWFNVSNANHVGSSTTVKAPDGTDYAVPGGGGMGGANYASLDYEEGIYLGYRFYETAAKDQTNGVSVLQALATTAVRGEGDSARNAYNQLPITAAEYGAAENMPHNDKAGYDVTDPYYNRYNGVLYPFGYGMSYTSFEWTILTESVDPMTDANKNENITIQVKVTNTGDIAGKDVVQIYSDPVYTSGGIEKASANLVTFAKTRLLQPQESQVLSLTFTPFELASFDDVDANGNGFAGYELEAGNYTLQIAHNSHEYEGSVTVTAAANSSSVLTTPAQRGSNGIAWTTDPVTGEEIEALFSKNDSLDNYLYANTRREGEIMQDASAALQFMTRRDFVSSFPDAPTAADVTFSQDAIAFLDAQKTYYSYMDKETDPWYKRDTDIPADWTQLTSRDEGAMADILLDDMTGVPLSDTAKWTAFMNQLTWDEMVGLISATGFQTPALEAIGKPKATDADGASQLVQNSTSTYWPNAVVIGATYNVELAELVGIMVGNESLFRGVQGWYAPSMNLHRSPFSGRNFEYYSQDGVQSGLIATAVVAGARAKGVVTYIKHFALNDQEQNRQSNGGVITWASEQAMREIYLRPFEYSVKKGDANATMGSFNRIGMMPSVNNYAFYVDLTRDEWGMEGYSITDMYAGGRTYWPGNIMARCGTGPLGTYSGTQVLEGTWDASGRNNKGTVMVRSGAAADSALVASPTQYWAVRDTAMRMLYVAANSNLMCNGIKLPLSAFADGTQVAVAGGFGTPAIPEIRKDLTVGDAGVEVSDLSIGLTADQMNALPAGTSVVYSVADGTLPDGLRLNASTGAITGTPTTAGEYNVTFAATVDRYITSNKVMKLIVTGGETPNPEMPGVTMRVSDGYIQYSTDGVHWTNLIAVEDLKGADGQNGQDGASGGCGASLSSFGIIAGILAAALTVCGILIVRRKKDNK